MRNEQILTMEGAKAMAQERGELIDTDLHALCAIMGKERAKILLKELLGVPYEFLEINKTKRFRLRLDFEETGVEWGADDE